MKYQKKLEAIAKENDGLRSLVASDALEQENAESYLKDVLQSGCQSGIVSGLIYYKDTLAFYNEHVDEIEALREETEEAIGESLSIGYPSYNWMSWFGYEETARKVADEIGMEF